MAHRRLVTTTTTVIVSLAVFVVCLVTSTAFSQDAAAAEQAREEAARREAERAQIREQMQRRAMIAQQLQVARAAAIDPNSFAGKDSTEGVYVPDSATAMEKFAVAQRMERLKEWHKSADLYQEVIEKYWDKVVPSRTNADDKIVQYTSVIDGVTEQLARWPKEGLDVYRARYEPTARGLIEAAGPHDLAEMHKVYTRYFVTDTARDVGMRLIATNLERGEFHAAARLADGLLSLHPGLSATQRAELLYRAALAHRLAGDDAKAKERGALLAKGHADVVGIVRGKKVNLAESIAQELGAVGAIGDGTMVASADSWLRPGGDASGGRIISPVGRTGALVWSARLSKPQWRNLSDQQRAQLEQAAATSANAGMTTGVLPVVDRGELFFQDGTRLYALSLESGLPLPGWAQTYPGPEDRAGQFVLPNTVGSPRAHQLTLTLTDRAVLGIMGQPDRSMVHVGQMPAGEPRLVCLDRQTGRQNWVVALSALELPKEIDGDQHKTFRTLQMNGSPLVIGDSVLVSARGIKQAQFEDCWVLCFHLATGKYRWACYVASSNNFAAAFGVPSQLPENTSHLAYANGRVYVLSNLGALAALDAYSGTIAWLNIYERGASPFDPNQPFNPFNQGRGGRGIAAASFTRPWVYNPVIVKDGHVFVLPIEGRHLHVYDANTGAELKRIRRGDYGNADQLLAVIGERAIIAGDKRVYCVNWSAYDEEKPEAALQWSSGELPDGMRGRPFVTSDSVFLTTPERLFRYSIKTGKAEDVYPKYPRAWDEKEEGPGNVLVTGEHVIIAGPSHVYGYTDMNLARARLDREVAAAPDDAAPRLRYAEVMFTAGELDVAVAKLDEAIALLGGMGSMRPGPMRDRTFNAALAFAQKVAGDSDGQQSTKELANKFFERAGAAAASPPQQVHYRLSRARFAEAARDAVAAVRLYQEILSQPVLRPVPLVDESNGGPTQAANVAELAIRQLVERAGSSSYAVFEQAAAKQLEAALAASPVKPEQLLDVAQTFPNSKVAPRAMLAAADAYEAAGKPGTGVQVLRQMYFKYPDSPEKARILESMARNYLALPNRADVAAARLVQGTAIPGEPKLSRALRLPDGREIAAGATFAKALEEVRKYSGQAASKNLPDFRVPVPPKYAQAGKANPRWPFLPAGAEQVIDGVAGLALPLRDFTRPDRVIAYGTDSRLSIYKPGDAKPLASGPALPDAPKGSAWLGGDGGALVWSAGVLMLVPDAGGADPLWRIDLKDLPDIEVVKTSSLPGAADAAVPIPRPGGRVVPGRGFRANNQAFIMRNGQVQAINPAVVKPRPDPAEPEKIDEVRPLGDRVLVATTTGRILSVELPTGRTAWQTRLSDRPADRIAANEDFTVLKVSDEQGVRLIAMDTYTGQVRGVRAFHPQAGDGVPCNIALSADGTLVYTRPDRLVLKDLYKPWDAPERDVIAGALPGMIGGGPPYASAIGPDQLVIAEGRILALAEAGTATPQQPPEKYVRVHSLETGQPITLRVPQEGGGMADLQLGAGTNTWDVKLRVIGPRLYVINPRTVLCYNLDRPEEYWEGAIDDSADTVPNVRDAFFGQKHVVLLSQPGVPQPRPGHYNLLAFARYPGKTNDTAESGRLDYDPTIVEQQNVTHWQGVEGGFYYLTGDGKLHFLAAVQ